MPALHQLPANRRGFTLIELLVVIVIIGILATLVAVYIVPSFKDNKNVVRTVDRVTVALMTAKMRALRDQLPRGVRFGVEGVVGNPGLTPPVVSQIVFIEQPDPYRVPSPPSSLTGRAGTSRPAPVQAVLTHNSGTVTFTTVAGVGTVDLIGSAPTDASGNALDYSETQIQPGDYFRYELGAPSNYRITAIKRTSLTLATPFPYQTFPTIKTNMYQIIRQPRAIAGESALDLPENVVVDLATVGQYVPGNQVPMRQTVNPAQTLGFWEIMFDPAGGVMATFGGTSGGGSAPIVLFVRDNTADNILDPNIGRAIVINPRTGKIAASPIAPITATNTNPFAYATDGKSSGI